MALTALRRRQVADAVDATLATLSDDAILAFDLQLARSLMPSSGFSPAMQQLYVERLGSIIERRRAEIQYARRTPEEIDAELSSAARHYLARAIESDTDTLAAWEEKFKNNAAYAFEWADGAMRAAARRNVYLGLLGLFEAETPIPYAQVAAIAQREALRVARHPSSSTSQPSNLMTTYTGSAYAEFLDDIK